MRQLHNLSLVVILLLCRFVHTSESDVSTCDVGLRECQKYSKLFGTIERDLAWWVKQGKTVTQKSHLTGMSNFLVDNHPPLVQIVNNELRCARYDSATYESGGHNCFPDDEDRMRLWQVLKLIKRMLTKYNVPDVQFFLSVCDSSLIDFTWKERVDAPENLLLISAAKTAKFMDLIAPGHSFTPKDASDNTQWQLWQTDAWQQKLDDDFPWASKDERAFWRGINVGSNDATDDGWLNGRVVRHRERIVNATWADNEDAKLYNVRFGNDMNDPNNETGRLSPFVPMRDHAASKYLLHIDGATYSSRYMKLLALNSVVFKQVSRWYEFFEGAMRPYGEYIPFDTHSTANLSAQLRWARENDEEARQIGKRGNAFAREMLSDASAECYWWRLLTRYSSVFSGPVEFSEGAQTFDIDAGYKIITGYAPAGAEAKTEEESKMPPSVDIAKVALQLRKFYQRHDPQKGSWGNIDNILMDWRNRWSKLGDVLESKYQERPFTESDIACNAPDASLCDKALKDRSDLDLGTDERPPR